jgi:hypothetical protein
MNGVLGVYDAAAVHRFFGEAGVFTALEQRGFADFEIVVDIAGRALPHALLYGSKDGQRYLLIDACVGEAIVRPPYFAARGHPISRPMEMAVVHWIREEDPTRSFSPERPPLPLQRHPGLGVLRRAFRVVVQMASELGKDGVVDTPKFFHDAVIFYRSRFFLFLDATEQGRFEALLRDLRGLSLGEASLALIGHCVRAADGTVAGWEPGYQIFPIAPELTAYLHASEYATRVKAVAEQLRFTVDRSALDRTRRMLGLDRAWLHAGKG